MTEEEVVVESSENIVEVEDELRERKLEAVEQAAKADDDEPDGSVPFRSPPVQGTGEPEERSYGHDRVRIRLMEELPDGTDGFHVPLPSTEEIQDDTHPLNRLLAPYGLEPDELADLNGERLPLRVKGTYDDSEAMNYEIDYPPVPTLPNRLIYRTRRGCERLGLVRWGRTPDTKTDILGDISSINYTDGRNSKAMTEAAEGLFYPLGLLPTSEETLVPTDRGVAALIGAWFASVVGLAFVASSLGSAALGVFTVLYTIVTILPMFPVILLAGGDWTVRALSWINRRFFPDSD